MKIFFCAPNLGRPVRERLCFECSLRSVSQLNNFRAYEAV